MNGVLRGIAAALLAFCTGTVTFGSESAVGTLLLTERYGRLSTVYVSRSAWHRSSDSAGIGIFLPHGISLSGSYREGDPQRLTGPLQLFLTTPWSRGTITAGIGFGEAYEENISAGHVRRCIGPDIMPYTCIDTVDDFITTVTSVRRRSFCGAAAASLHSGAGRILFAGIDGSYTPVSGLQYTQSTAQSSITAANYARDAWEAATVVTAGVLDSFEFLGTRRASIIRLLWNSAATSSQTLPDDAVTGYAGSQRSAVTLLQYTGDRTAFNRIHLSYRWEVYDIYQLLRERLKKPLFSAPFFVSDTLMIAASYEERDIRRTIANRWTRADGSYEYGTTGRRNVSRTGEVLAVFGTTLHFLRYGYLRGSSATLFGSDFSSTGIITVADIDAGLMAMVKRHLFIDVRCTPLRVSVESDFAPDLPPYRFVVSLRAVMTGL